MFILMTLMIKIEFYSIHDLKYQDLYQLWLLWHRDKNA